MITFSKHLSTLLIKLIYVIIGASLTILLAPMAKASAVQKIIALPDVHAPFQDERAIKVVEAFKKDFGLHTTIALGDFIDGTYVSTFPKDIEAFDTLDEFEAGNDLLDRLLKPGDYYLEGNHEERYRRKGVVPKGYRRLLSPSRWLNLKKRKIGWVPYSSRASDVLKFGTLSFIHGFACNQYAAMKTALRFGSVVFGHTHRIQVCQPPHVSYRWTGFNIGCLCELDQEYAETREPTGWAHGFGFGYIYKSGSFTWNVVRLIGDKVHIEGKEYEI